jgi:uncharacterized protein
MRVPVLPNGTTVTGHPVARIPEATSASAGLTVAGHVSLLLVAAFGTNVVLASILPPAWPLPVLQLVIAAGAVAVAVPLTAWSGRRLRPARSLRDRGLRWDRARRLDAAVGVGIGMVAATLPLGIAVATGAFVPVATLDGGDLGLLVGLGLLVLGMVLVATWEELLLRGVLVGELVGALRRRVPPRLAAAAAVTIGGVLFGLGHAGQPDRPVLLTTWIVAGLVFGAVYLLDGSLALVIGAHAGFNIAHNALLVRADGGGTRRLSSLVRVEQVPDHWWLSTGGVIEMAGFLLVAVLAMLWVRVRSTRQPTPAGPEERS